MPLNIYKASAGSGKTYRLVLEYLKIVLKNPYEYKSILAITFTNKATQEMKGRILQDLENIVNDESDKLQDLKEALTISEEELKKNAQKTLELILHDYSRFEVCTIDSFFTKIVKSFAKELQLPMRYDMEMSADVAIEASISYLFAELGENRQLLKWLLSFAYSNMDKDKGWKIENILKETGETIFQEDVFTWLLEYDFNFADLEKEIKKANNIMNEYEQKLTAYSHQFEQFINAHNLVFKDFNRGVATWILQGIRSKKYNNYGVTFLKTLEGEDWVAKKKSDTREIILALQPELNDIAHSAYYYAEENEYTYNTAKAFSTYIYAYGILSHLEKGVVQYREEKNLLLIADVGAIIRQAIGEGDAPFIYEKIGNYYKHIFIDEFQDTSNFQWENLRPLVDNSLSDENNVLIVGDVKQSIYRFRGGNMNLLLKDVYNHFVQMFGTDQIKNETLDENWRSSKEVVSFNNMFFKELCTFVCEYLSEDFDTKTIENSYQKLEQKINLEGDGYVEMRFLDKEKSSEDEKSGSFKTAAKNELLRSLKTLKSDGYNWKDVMILTFKNQGAIEISELLVAHDIPFVSAKSLLLNSALSVKFLVQLLKHLQDPNDALAHSASLYLYFKWKKKPIWNKHGIFTDFDREKSVVKDKFPPAFFERKTDLQRLSVYELIEELCCIFEMNLVGDTYLQFFANLCLKQATRGVVTTYDFLQYWEENKEKLYIKTPDNINAISILTVHQAKGLEKPIVYVPFLAQKKSNKDKLFWSNNLPQQYKYFGFLPLPKKDYLEKSHFREAYLKEMLMTHIDNINKLYVAFTRPKNRLYVYVPKPSKKNKFTHKYLDWAKTVLEKAPLSEHYNRQEMIFCLGTESPKIKGRDKVEEVNILQGVSRQYSNFINIRMEAQEKFILLDTSIEASISEGVKAHAVLEKLYEKNDLENVLSLLLSEGVVSLSDMDYLRTRINVLFENELFASWFDNTKYRVLAERELFEGNSRIHKPDRLLISGNSIVVIDYKKLSEDDRYIAQVRRYGKLLTKMGFQKVEKYLVYVDTGVIKKID